MTAGRKDRNRLIYAAINSLPSTEGNAVTEYILKLEEEVELLRSKIEYLERNESFHQHELLIAQNR